ncbi:alpha/beta hydrolase [Yeosuana aromativorans]|uniref:Alpha/beta hydrolase n=1 Tax=Yeosuana aromativorans TaxID=288019 RepID=A0A8J3FFD7_9FLAO|nr:alpha/beta fold hydrolase [Yeosuana aromativorans]GGK12442.1 alpha/beta hydrolase [Yeosuana aromativorans]
MVLQSNILGKGQGQAFVILHGFLGMSDNWKTLGKQFSESGFEVHLVDQRNHGSSFWDDTFNYDVLADDLKHYCDVHKLSNIILLGHSMGGKTAMMFAAKYPQLVSKLIVADISPKYYPVHHETILEGLHALDFDIIKSRTEADELLSQYISDFGTRQFLLKNLYWKEKGQLALRMNLKVLTDQIEAVGEALPAEAIYDKYTLFLKGSKSNYITDDDKSLIHHHFPKAQIVTIKNAGHWLHAENPQDFFDVVMGFLK